MSAVFALTTEQLLECGIGIDVAARIAAGLAAALIDSPDSGGAVPTALPKLWPRISKVVLRPDQPFALHKLLFEATYQSWDAAVLGPPPAWVPTPCAMAATNAARFMSSWPGDETWRQLRSGEPGADWDLLQRISFSNPEAFWPHLLQQLTMQFHTPPERMLVVGQSADSCCWLPGARFNIAECALSSPDPDRPAVVWADEATPHMLQSMSYGQLAAHSAHVAAALRSMGLKPGDAVAINMPMSPEAVAALLGIILQGCVAVCIADSFAAVEVAGRCSIAQTKAIFTQDVILRGGQSLPLYVRVIEAGGPPAIVLAAAGGQCEVQLRPGDVSWEDFLHSRAPPPGALHAHIASAADTALVLFSSGTTGEPKAIPWTHVTPLRCAANAFFHQDVQPGDVACWPTSMGWMLGPWLVFAALLNGASIALLQGSPQGAAFGRFVQAAEVTMLGVVPSLVGGWRASGCMKGLDWSRIRCFSSAGEASAPDDVLWLMARAGYKPVMDSCGGTEIAGSFLTGSPLQPQAPSTFSTPTIGHCPVIMTQQADGSPSLSFHGDSASVTGELALAVPCLGVSQRLLNKDHRQAYYEGMPEAPGGRWFLRRHGDEMERLPGGAYRALGRVDDTMNLGGIKVSSVELERVCVAHVEGVLEAAAVAAPTPGGGPEQLFLSLVLRPGSTASAADLQQRCQAAISSQLNPLFRVHKALLRSSLPRNASNKVMRRELRANMMRSQSKM